jgi:hypothetical protein
MYAVFDGTLAVSLAMLLLFDKEELWSCPRQEGAVDCLQGVIMTVPIGKLTDSCVRSIWRPERQSMDSPFCRHCTDREGKKGLSATQNLPG